VTTVVMKNCEPLVFLPAFAMDRSPGLVCLSWKFSSEEKKIKNLDDVIPDAAPHSPANFSP
jgi:hypothetical protein